MSGDLVDELVAALGEGPMKPDELAARVGRSRNEVTGALYRRGDLFDRADDGVTWSLYRPRSSGSADKGRPGSSRATGDLAPTGRGEPVPGRQQGRVPRPPRSKAEALTMILDEVRSPRALRLSPGSTEPKDLFLEVSKRLGLDLDDQLSKVELARAIAALGGRMWPANGDSLDTPSGGGDTVTLVGLQTVWRAVYELRRGHRSSGSSARPDAGDDLPVTARPVSLPAYRPASGGIDAAPNEIVQDWDALDRATIAHARLQDQVAEVVRAAGLEPLSPSAGQPQFDIAWHTGGRFVVCEVKSATIQNVVQQARLGLGQVIEYRRALAAEQPDVVAVLVSELEPPRATSAAVTSVGVRLATAGSLDEDLAPLL